MDRKKLRTRLASTGAAALLALGVVACQEEGGGDLDPGQEAPEGDAGLEGEGDTGLEGEGGGLEGEGDAQGEGGTGLEGGAEGEGEIDEDF